VPTPSPSATPVSLRARRRREDLSRRREDTLAGATAVFAERGFHDAQMGGMAAAAEVSRKTLYAMFESKELLYQEVIDLATRAKRSGYLPGLDAEAVAVSLVGSVMTTAARWIELTPERPFSEQRGKVRSVFAKLIRPMESA